MSDKTKKRFYLSYSICFIGIVFGNIFNNYGYGFWMQNFTALFLILFISIFIGFVFLIVQTIFRFSLKAYQTFYYSYLAFALLTWCFMVWVIKKDSL